MYAVGNLQTDREWDEDWVAHHRWCRTKGRADGTREVNAQHKTEEEPCNLRRVIAVLSLSLLISVGAERAHITAVWRSGCTRTRGLQELRGVAENRRPISVGNCRAVEN